MLIESYELQIEMSTHSAEEIEYEAIAHLNADISPVLPYLNATLSSGIYVPKTPVLSWRYEGHNIGFWPDRIAVDNLEGSLSTTGLFNADKNTFALQVEGESMIGAGILPGDYVIVDSKGRVRNGAIAAVRIGDEATVKRVFINKRQARLKAENPDYEDIVVDRNSPDFAVYGPVIGVMRKL